MDRKLSGSTLLESLVAIIIVSLSITLSTMVFLVLLGKQDSRSFYLDQYEMVNDDNIFCDNPLYKKEFKLEDGRLIYDYEIIEGRDDILKVSVKRLDSQGRTDDCIYKIINL